MKRSLFYVGIAFLILGFGISGHPSSKARILPFKVWKQKKIDEAKSVVSELKRENRKTTQAKTQVKSDANDSSDDTQDTAQQLSQAELNLGVARELSANDYFLLYVSPQFKNNNDALVQAARALSPRDMADILTAYQKKLQATDIATNAAEDDPNIPEKTTKSP